MIITISGYLFCLRMIYILATLTLLSHHTDHTPITLQSHTNHTPITHQPYTNHTPITHQSHTNHTAQCRGVRKIQSLDRQHLSQNSRSASCTLYNLQTRYNTTPNCIISHYTTLYHMTLYHMTLYHITLCHVISHNTCHIR